MDDIILTDRYGKKIQNPCIEDIQKALRDLFLAKTYKNALLNYVSILNSESMLEMQIYQQTVILQDWLCGYYDGPGGPGELLRTRYKEGALITKIEEAVDLLLEEEREKLITLLKTVPKPEVAGVSMWMNPPKDL